MMFVLEGSVESFAGVWIGLEELPRALPLFLRN